MADYHRAKELFLQARERPPRERAAWLEDACGGDTALRDEVGALLAAEGTMPAEYLAPVSSLGLVPGAILSHYRILKPLGTGGMGEVWLAEQHEPVRRRVALKLIKWGLSSREVLARFEAERQALALMVHPGIAQVYDAGTTPDGRPYFAMEYVPGLPITEHCDRGRLGVRQRLELFREVCLAVQHAHQKGVIHRDLKPGNVLVAEVDGTPHAKIIDFGVAKATLQRLTERTLYTELNLLIGTPEYMSPEQADPDPAAPDVDTRSDIYSLGVILYELLTGQLPFDANRLREVGYGEMLRILQEEEPPSLPRRVSALGEAGAAVAEARNTDANTLARALRGDLDWIVRKALRKEPERRYASVAGLVADLDRYLVGRPVEARPATLVYRVQRFVNRHRVGVAAAALVLMLLLAYAVTVTVQARALARERDRAQAEAAKAQQVTSFVIDLFGTADPEYALGETFTARQLLDRGAARVGDELAGRPELLAPLLGVVGEIYQRLGVYGEAEARLRQALAAAQKSGRPEDEADALHKLGRTLVERQETAAAAPLLQQALALRRRHLGKEHPLVAETLESLSRLHLERKELKEAEALARQGLALLRASVGDEDRRTAFLRYRLGFVLMERGDYAGAEEALRESLATRRRLLPAQHPEIAASLAIIANVLRITGRYDEAASLYREAVATQRRVLGDEHPWVARTLGSLAGLLDSQGKLDEAESLFRQVLEARRKSLGEIDPDVAMAFNDLGLVIQEQGRLNEAEEHYREALMRYSEDHPWRSSTLLNLGSVLEARGELAEAAAIYREQVAQQTALLGEDHDRVALRQALLGGALARQGLDSEAESLLRQALKTYRAKLPADHPRQSYVLVPLGRLLCLRGDADEGEPMLVEGHRLRRQIYGADNLRTAEAALALGSCLAVLGRIGEAREHLTSAHRTFAAKDDRRLSEAAAAIDSLSNR